jgi:hypothetical protein
LAGWGCALAALALPAAAAAAEDGPDTASGTSVTPYIEAVQVLSAQLEPFNDTVTYTALAVGVDAQVVGRTSAASVSLRYERRIGWDDDTLDGDTISGVARAGIALAQGVTLEAGALASRSRVEGDGAITSGGFAGIDDSTSQIYSGYIGPSVHTMSGDVEIEGHYRFGYTRVEEPDALVLAPGAQPADFFDESTTHNAYLRAGVRPDVVAPVGLGIGGGWNEQNIDNLDQRIRDRYVRADAILPVSPSLAVVGGVGYEDVEVSSRDAVRDTLGNPVIGSDGRFVTDHSAPRQIAYQTDGLIWDAGVMWRPSRRTSFEAYVGHRYGSMSYHGSFSYEPNSHESMYAVVYDNVTSFGGALVNTVAGLPSQFNAFRNPISGQIGGCVASLQGGSCFGGSIATVNAAVFRNRGAAYGYSADLGRTQVGAGVGYDRRKFIGAAGTVLGTSNDVVDESIWAAIYASTELDARSSVTANANMSWFESGLALSDDITGYSASLAYDRDLIRGLSATAAVAFDGVSRENLEDFMAASALVGLRYSFF